MFVLINPLLVIAYMFSLQELPRCPASSALEVLQTPLPCGEGGVGVGGLNRVLSCLFTIVCVVFQELSR